MCPVKSHSIVTSLIGAGREWETKAGATHPHPTLAAAILIAHVQPIVSLRCLEMMRELAQKGLIVPLLEGVQRAHCTVLY